MGHGSRSPSPGRRRDRERRKRGRSRDRRRRSRSRERSRERERSRSRERERSRSRDRSREHRHRRGSRSPPRTTKVDKKTVERPQVSEKDLEGKSVEEIEMMRTMGFCAFDTTKGKQVTEKEPGAVHVILKRKYRQYMNRKGGFNRPLDFVA